MTAIPAAPVQADPLRALPLPDLRPPAVHWHRPPAAYSRMTPLPLDPEAGVDRPAAAEGLPGDDFEGLRAHARSLLGALVDVIQGRRPTTQLTRWVSDEVMADLVLRARLHQRAPQALAVRSIRIQRQGRTVVEVSGRLQAGERFTAAALRLEQVGSRWFCPVADFGPLAHAGDHPLPRLRGAREGTPGARPLPERCQRRL